MKHLILWIASGLAVVMIVTPMILKFGFGLHIDVMESGSMSPEINVGDLVISRQSDDIREGDIARYYEPNRTDPTIHRVVRIEDKDGKTIYRTKGDANDLEDLGYLPESEYQEEVVLIIGDLWGLWGIMHEIKVVLIAFGIAGAVLSLIPWSRFVVLRAHVSSSENTP